MRLPPFGRGIKTTSAEDLAEVLHNKLEELGYFPIYITNDIKRKIQDLQDEELDLRKRKAFTTEKALRMLQEIDRINVDLEKAEAEYHQSKIGSLESVTRKKKHSTLKLKRKVKKVMKHK